MTGTTSGVDHGLLAAQAAAREKRRAEGTGEFAPPAWEPANRKYISPRISTIEPTEFEGQPVPERKWIVRDWIPRSAVTILGGDGGVGKSLLGMQLLTATATGKAWLEQPTTACRALGVFCEDDRDELHRRQAAINAHYGVEFAGLGSLTWVSRVGDDAVMMDFDRGDHGRATEFFQQVHDDAQDLGAQLIVLDALHDFFAGNENARSQARQFVNLLCRLALDCDGAVVLTAHPSLTGLATGTGLSGSTAWNNAVRSRLYLMRPKAEEGEEVDDRERTLSRIKANYSGRDALRLRWEDGVFKAQLPETGIFGTIERRSADRAFLDGLDALSRAGRNVSDSQNAGNYAPRAISRTPQAKGYRIHQLAAAMERLFAEGKICVEEYGRTSDPRKRVARTEAQEEADDET